MKSLLYREWLLNRRHLLLNLALLLLLGMLMLLVRLSMLFGNLRRVEDLAALNDVTYLMFGMFFPLFAFILPSDSIQSHSSDIQSGFQKFRYTLPVTPLQCTAAKYILKALLLAVAWGISLLWVAFLNATGLPSDMPADIGSILLCFGAFLSACTDLLRTPLTLFSRTMRQMTLFGWISGMLPLFLLYGIGGGWFYLEYHAWVQQHAKEDFDGMLQMLGEKYALLLQHAALFLFLGSLLLFALSFGLSLLAMQRRET